MPDFDFDFASTKILAYVVFGNSVTEMKAFEVCCDEIERGWSVKNLGRGSASEFASQRHATSLVHVLCRKMKLHLIYIRFPVIEIRRKQQHRNFILTLAQVNLTLQRRFFFPPSYSGNQAWTSGNRNE